ncbi:MAG: glycosyltransferase [Acidobacteria bacterium]|nr:glycosyltransferase [Acidobacteriota bacterium]
MPRALLVSYFFPPAASVGGVRAHGLARYLPRHGWDVAVLTPSAEGRDAGPLAIIETGDRPALAGLKRRLGGEQAALRDLLGVTRSSGAPARRLAAWSIAQAKAATAFPDPRRGWIAPALASARAWLAHEHVDAIVSTSPPPTAHVIASRLAREFGLPWVADFRDLWADYHNADTPAWRRAVDRRLERRTLRGARALVTVSAPLAATLAAHYPGVPVRTILNGFDPAEWQGQVALTPEFTLTHTGTLYQGRRDPTPVFAALAELVGERAVDRGRVRVRLFSRNEDWLRPVVAAQGLQDVVEVRDWAPRAEAIAAQRESQVLLLFHLAGPDAAGDYTGKIFEYLAARRPILVAGGEPGVLGELVRKTGAGVHARGVAEIKAALRGFWDAYARSGEVPYTGRADFVARYSHDRMAAEFAALLDEARGQPRPPSP